MEKGRKNVLMICPGFFGYREAIAREIENLGFSVDVYDERLEGGFWAKAMIRLNCRLYYPVIEKYYGRIAAENRHKDYDYIFVVKGEAITPRVMQQLRQTWPRAEFVLYLWDSVKNVPQGQTRLGWYDRVLTFDPEDAKAYGLQFRPLFFSREFSGIPSGGEDTYAVAFIGTAHSIRPRVIHQLTQQCQSLGKKIFAYQPKFSVLKALPGSLYPPFQGGNPGDLQQKQLRVGCGACAADGAYHANHRAGGHGKEDYHHQLPGPGIRFL